MDTRCTVCTHAARPEIDQALMDGLPLRPLAARYGLSSSALSRHLKHLRQALAAQDDREHQAHQVALLDELDLQKVRLNRLFRKAEDLHSLHVSLGCIQETLRLPALQAKMRYSLSTQVASMILTRWGPGAAYWQQTGWSASPGSDARSLWGFLLAIISGCNRTALGFGGI